MASTIRVTYSLDSATLEKLNRLSHRWRVSKSEVVRRALRQVVETPAPSPEERLAALHTLQRWAKENRIDLDKWKMLSFHPALKRWAIFDSNRNICEIADGV